MIGKAIKYMRIKKGYTQENLGKICNIGRTTLSDYEREKTNIDFDILEKISKVCGYKIYFVNENEKFQVKDLERKDV